MREQIKDKGRLEHILQAINDIQEYHKQYTYDDVKNSKFVFYGFTKFVEVIGEAVYMLTKEFRESHQEVFCGKLNFGGRKYEYRRKKSRLYAAV